MVYTFIANVHSTAENKKIINDYHYSKKNSPLTYTDQSYTHIETSQMICTANDLTGFYMSVTLIRYRFRISLVNMTKLAGNLLCIVNKIGNITETNRNKSKVINKDTRARGISDISSK